MIIHRRRLLGEFILYTVEEAKELGIEYSHWSIAEEGKYCITDDGLVCIVRMVKPTKDGTCVYLPFGHYFTRKGKPREKALYEGPKKSSNVKNKNGYIGFLLNTKSRDSIKPLIMVMARAMVEGKKFSRAEEEELAKQYFHWRKKPHKVFKEVMRNELVMAEVSKEIGNILAQYGVTEEFVIKEGFVKSMEIAKKQNNGTLLLKTSVELAKMLGMYPDKSTVTSQMTVTETQYLDDMIERESKQLLELKNESSQG